MFKQVAARILYRYKSPSDLRQNLDKYYIYLRRLIPNFIEQTHQIKKTQPKNMYYQFSKQSY